LTGPSAILHYANIEVLLVLLEARSVQQAEPFEQPDMAREQLPVLYEEQGGVQL
jgi:hypothetical protein